MNEWEKRLMDFQTGRMDNTSFMYHLYRAAFKADLENRRRLALGFPELILAIELWTSEEGYAFNLRAEYNGLKEVDSDEPQN